MTCKNCGNQRIRRHFPSGTRTVCDPCQRIANRNNMRLVRGSKSLDEQTYPPMAKGRRSERIVERHLRFNGYGNVCVLGGPGQPDITFEVDGKIKAVEVKSVIKRTGPCSWYVDKVSSGRKSDDYIALVLPNDSVLLFSMAEHLKKCSPSGILTVSSIVRESSSKQSEQKKYA